MYVTNNWDALYLGRPVKVAALAEEVEATLVSKQERDRDSYGDYYEGDGDISMIFQVGDKYYRKTGYQSSYGDGRSWDGPVVEVKPITKTVTVFE